MRNRESYVSILATTVLLSVFSHHHSGASSLTLAWDSNTEDDLAGYYLYYGTQSRDYDHTIDVGNVTQYTVRDLEPGTRYYLSLTAYDISGNESDFSSEVNGVPEEAVKVISPNGGEILTSGGSHPIEWETNGIEDSVSRVIIQYSRNGGRVWKRVASLRGNPGMYEWSVPKVRKTKSQCTVKVVLKGARRTIISNDTSDNYFTIGP
jgi:fibronectin type 3 domain-containing protein